MNANGPSEATVREEICEIGRRIYARQMASGNDGNISYRLSENEVLCSPTMICKGFMQPDDLCVVDLDGNQLRGERRKTSEILLHLEIYKHDPATRAVVHCHPPHATAFGMARIEIPTGVLPEVEVFLGEVPRAPYETPGSQVFAETIRPYVGKANTVVLTNHGTVSWAESVEHAYWRTEILDGYCRMLLIASQLGGVGRLEAGKVRELLALRENFGMPADPRLSSGKLYNNPDFGPPVEER